MALNRPTLQELRTRIEADFLSSITVGWGILRRSFIRVLSRIQAGIINLNYGFVDNLSIQFFATKATDSFLDEKGEVWVVTRKPATKATGSITPTGTATTVIPIETIFKNADGVEYTTQEAVTLPNSVDVKASTGGIAGNLDSGEILTLDAPIASVDTEATVDTGGLSGGGDIESDDNYRTRILNRIQISPSGGKETDYSKWVNDYAGSFSVEKVWVFPLQEGPAKIKIYFTLYDDAQQPPFINPNASQLSEMQTEIDKKAPVTAIPDVDAPTQREVSIVMDLTPNTTAVQDAVKASLRQYFKDNSEVSMTLLLSQLNEAISLATGEVDHAITDLEVDSVAVAVGNINFDLGELPVLSDADVTFN